jgi:sigma-B regulation protein RsbU (phosphoserine phosphatase)
MMAFLRKRGKLLRFRTKLLIVLLCLSLGPILLMRTTGTGAIKRMLGKFIPQAREYLVTKHENYLQTVVEHFSYSNMLGGQILELIIYMQAQAVQRALADNPYNEKDPLFVKNHGELTSQDMAVRRLEAEYYRLNRNGEQRPLKVDTKSSAFFKVPGATGQELERDQEMLRAMLPGLIRISKYAGAYALWQVTALENGLFSVYPGVDHVPPNYDPRKTLWYRRAAGSKQMVWSLAHADPITKRSVLNLAMPVKRPDGSMAGITTLAVPVSMVLERKEVLDQVPPNTHIIMAAYDDCANCPEDSTYKSTKEGEVLIVATQTYDKYRRWNWMQPQKPQMLTSQHDIPFKAMLMDLRAGRSGSQRMEYKGEDSLWIYGPMGGQSFTLIITPYAEVLDPINQVEQHMVTEISDLMRMVLAIGAAVMAVVVVVAFLFSRSVTRPISQLAEASRRLGEGDFDTRVEIKTFDEFQQIGKAFNELGPRLRENYQLRQALALAMEVQQRLLPQSQPDVNNLDIYGKSIYCDETGGDYYDFIFGSEANGKGTFVVVGDVTGHGLPAALLMASARAFLRQRVSMLY